MNSLIGLDLENNRTKLGIVISPTRSNNHLKWAYFCPIETRSAKGELEVEFVFKGRTVTALPVTMTSIYLPETQYRYFDKVDPLITADIQKKVMLLLNAESLL